MARGVRSNPVLLPTFSQGQQPQSMASYDPRTRRNTILIAEIVPTLNTGESQQQSLIPSDRYYCLFGDSDASGDLPAWFSSTSNVTFGNWDATREAFYVQFSSAAGAGGLLANVRTHGMVYPGGPYGVASRHAPKNAAATAVVIEFEAKFAANAAYTFYGVGAIWSGGSYNSALFSQATDQFIQVTRNVGNWLLATADGSTRSEAESSGGADGDWHAFKVVWSDGSAALYVDGESVLTKTTNLPTRPLSPGMYAQDNTNTIGVIDYLVSWEVG